MNEIITTIPRIFQPEKVSDWHINDVLWGIKTGIFNNQDLRGITQQIQSQSNHDLQGQMKSRYLPAAMFNGTFSYKNNDSLITYSSFTALDFDQFESEEKLNQTSYWLTQTPCVYSVYRTPSGKGLKAIVYHDNTNPSHHAELYSQLLQKFGISETDSSVCDLARGNYLCYDPNLWINSNVTPYHFLHDPNYTKPTVTAQRTSTTHIDIGDLRRLTCPISKKSDESIINILNSKWRKNQELWKEGNRANSVFSLASQLCNCGVNIDKALSYLIKSYKEVGLREEEISYNCIRGYQNNYQSYGCNRKLFDNYGSKGR